MNMKVHLQKGIAAPPVRLAIVALLLATVAVAAIFIRKAVKTSGPDIPVPDYWPTAGWRSSTPEAQGIDSGKLADLLLTIREQNVQIHSLLIIRHGYVVLDATFYPYDGKTPHNVASVTKSLMTTLIGIASDQGKLALDDKMVSFFPHRTIASLDPRKQNITVRHLASMSSGLDCAAEPDEPTLKEMVASPDYVQFVLDREVAWEPGTQFVYCSPAIHMLSPILQQAAGMTTLDFARHNLFEPLGFEISEAASGLESLSLAQTCQPDVILMDLLMPEMTGFKTVKALRQLPAIQAKRVVIIATSARVFDHE